MGCLKSKAEFGTFWHKFSFWGVKIESYIHISMALIVELAVMDCFQSCCYPLYLNSIPLFHQKITAKHHNHKVNTKKLAYFELQFLFTKMQNLFSLEL